MTTLRSDLKYLRLWLEPPSDFGKGNRWQGRESCDPKVF